MEGLPHICFVAPKALPVLTGDRSIEFIGGAELQQVIVARSLVQHGFRVSMICLDFGQEDQVQIDGITVFRAYQPNKGIPKVRFFWPRLTSLWACFRRADADIYYQRTAGLVTGVLAAFCRRNDKRSVFAAAGNPDLEPNTPRIQSRWARRLYEYGLKHVDRILVQNTEQAHLCRLHLGREPVLIPNCYPAPAERDISKGERILWVSNLRTLKRPQLLLELAAACREFEFTMVGGADPQERQLFEDIRGQARSLSNVEFLGFVPHNEIDKLFSQAALFVNTSESEGFPNTFLQAWSRGIPTVSFIDSGARMNGKPIGQIVGSVSDMITVVTGLMHEKQARLQAGIECREYFEANHLPERVIDLYKKLFLTLHQKAH